MRKLLVLLSLIAVSAFAEATFDQIEGLIQQKNYAAAEKGLEVIIKNHPNSAKAFYAMAQAQAGLGNQDKAQKALDIATGLNPTLDFAPSSSVASLKQAITPQTAKIEAVEESHLLRNFGIVLVLLAGGGLIVALVMQKQRKDEEAELSEKLAAQAEAEARAEAKVKRMQAEREAEEATERAKTSKVTDIKGATASIATSGPAVPQPTYTPQPTHTTVVNNTSSSNDLLTTMVVMDMLSDHHHHDTTRVVEREVIREVPAPAPTRDTSWDDTPAPSRSNSWDISSSSSRSSSWDDSSSSSSSSSWSSSSSDSSSSWGSSDSGSSSSSSDW